jgi:hypothetical protein
MKTLVVDTLIRRAQGERPARGRSLAVAGLAALGTGALVYRLLRA